MKKDYITIAVIALFMLGALIYGFNQVGSPRQARAEKLDQTRVTSLTALKGAIESYHYTNKKLPEKLIDITNQDGYRSYMLSNMKDPESHLEYAYQMLDATHYTLCAFFATESNPRQTLHIEEFKHSKGYQCFNLEVTNR